MNKPAALQLAILVLSLSVGVTIILRDAPPTALLAVLALLVWGTRLPRAWSGWRQIQKPPLGRMERIIEAISLSCALAMFLCFWMKDKL
jgi:hypothetical protein